jgi:hypothetical protein
MTVMDKSYPIAAEIVWNVVADIAEMRKGKVTRNDSESMILETEMYGIKTQYDFRVARSPTGTTVTIETEGKSEEDERGVQLMFASLDNMLAPFAPSQ